MELLYRRMGYFEIWHNCRLSFWAKKASGCQSYVKEIRNFYFYSLASFCFSVFVSISLWNVPQICCLLIMYVLIMLCNDCAFLLDNMNTRSFF